MFIRHTDSGLLCVSDKKREGGRRCFYFYQIAASLRQSQPLRQWIYKFSCSGLINHEQHAAPWDQTFLGGPQQKLCKKALLMSCSRNDQWTLNEDLGSGQNERKPGGPLVTSWPPKGRGGSSSWTEVMRACHLEVGSLIFSFSGDFHSLLSMYFLVPWFLLISILVQVGPQLFLSFPQFKKVAVRGCNFKTFFIHLFTQQSL